MAFTASTAFSQAFTTSVQAKVLKTLRAELFWANPAWAEHGTFDKGSDLLMFLSFPDLSITTPLTPLTEGVAPTGRAFTMNAVTVGTAQYGDLVNLSDLAKIKSPIDAAAKAADLVHYSGMRVIDQVCRDAIFTGGTPYYAIGASSNVTRADIASTELLVGKDLIKLKSTMKKNKLEPGPDGFYKLFIHPNVGYDLKVGAGTGTDFVDV